jgi:hypothetical protein
MDEIADPAFRVSDVWCAISEAFDNNIDGGLNILPASYA